MLAVIAPSQSVAVLATANECCLVPTASNLPQHRIEQAPSQQWDVPAQVHLQPVSLNGTKQLKQQMGVVHLHSDQGTGSAAMTVSSSVPAATSDAVLEPNSTASSTVPVKRERRSSGRSERRPSRGESERRPSRGESERRPSRGERKAAPPVAGYSTDSYWNSRYAERSTHFDWFYNYSALAELIGTTCDSQAGPCLHVGCGNSGFSEGMVQDGFEVLNVDISPVVIEQMRIMDQMEGQTWEVADCRSMPQYADGSFGSVLDKGTLDAVLCSSHGTADAVAYINEVFRLLEPGGVFLLISLGQPHARLTALKCQAAASHVSTALPYLSVELQQRAAASAAATAAANGTVSSEGSGVGDSTEQQWEWESVEVYLLPKPSLYLQSESSLTGKPIVSHMRHSDKDMPVEWLGPFTPGAELDAFIAQQSLNLREFFTAFACTKPGAAASAAAREC